VKVKVHDSVLDYEGFPVKWNQGKYNKWKEKQGNRNQIKPGTNEEIANTCFSKTSSIKKIEKYTNN
jgi:hypothetical protein